LGVKYYYFLPNFFTPLFKTGISDNGFSCFCRLLPLGFTRFWCNIWLLKAQPLCWAPAEGLWKSWAGALEVLGECYGNAKAMLEIK